MRSLPLLPALLLAVLCILLLAHDSGPRALIDATPRPPLVHHAGLQLCTPVGPQADDSDADGDDGDTQMLRPEPAHQPQAPERPIIA